MNPLLLSIRVEQFSHPIGVQPRTLNEIKTEAIVAAFEENGRCIRATARALCISEPTVRRFVQIGIEGLVIKRGRKLGTEFDAKLTVERRRQMVADMKAGVFSDMTTCAEAYGVSRECVRQILRKAGSSIRLNSVRKDETRKRLLAKRDQRRQEKRARLAEEARQLSAHWNNPALDNDALKPLFKTNWPSRFVQKWRKLFPDLFPQRYRIRHHSAGRLHSIKTTVA